MDVSAVLTVAAETAGASGLVTVSSRAAGWLRDRAVHLDHAGEVRALLGLRQAGTVASGTTPGTCCSLGQNGRIPTTFMPWRPRAATSSVAPRRPGCSRYRRIP